MEAFLMVLWFLFTYFSLFLYAFVLVVLVRHRNDKHLNSSFFVISVSLGICEITSTIFMHFYQIWPKFGFFIDDFYLKYVKGYFATMCDQWNWMLINVQSYLILLATVNRTLSIVFPTTYRKVFNRRNTTVICVAIWVLTALMFAPIPFLTSSRYRYIDTRNTTDGLTTKAMCAMENETMQQAFVFFISFVQLIVSVCGLIMYCTIIAVVVRHKFTSQGTRRVFLSVEIRLTMTMFFQVVLYAVNCIVVFFGFFFIPEKLHLFVEISYVTGDVTAMSTPYFLLLFSSRLRKAHIRCFSRRPPTATKHVTPTVKFSQSRSSNLTTASIRLI